jgi:hypothetical protein
MQWLVKIFVPAFAFICVLYSLITHKDRKTIWVSAALLMCAIAETIGACGMSFGIIVFILCHVCLSVYFLLNQPITKKD